MMKAVDNVTIMIMLNTTKLKGGGRLCMCVDSVQDNTGGG